MPLLVLGVYSVCFLMISFHVDEWIDSFWNPSLNLRGTSSWRLQLNMLYNRNRALWNKSTCLPPITNHLWAKILTYQSTFWDFISVLSPIPISQNSIQKKTGLIWFFMLFIWANSEALKIGLVYICRRPGSWSRSTLCRFRPFRHVECRIRTLGRLKEMQRGPLWWSRDPDEDF